MKQVTVYTRIPCPYCVAAKNLLTQLGIPFEEKDLSGRPDELRELMQKTKMRTVPQIFVDDHLIGGFQELEACHKEGKLMQLLDDGGS